MNINNFENANELFNYLISKGPCIIEEVVINHPEIRKINPKALSTVRMPTVRTKQGAEIFQPCIRFGHNNLIADGVASGGLVALINIDSGIVETKAHDKYGNKYIFHPDTSEQILGFKIPLWGEALDLAKKLSETIPSNRYVGWDLALTEKGWIMIEGNARGELYLQQFPDRIGKKLWLESLIQNK